MTEEQKDKILDYRKKGQGYKMISKLTGLSLNTIKSFCRRNSLKDADLKRKNQKFLYCEQCGKLVEQAEKRKKKRFCSDDCRNKWWNAHLELVKRKSNYELICLECRKKFYVYGNADRKYCSHQCYIQHRFGGKENE